MLAISGVAPAPATRSAWQMTADSASAPRRTRRSARGSPWVLLSFQAHGFGSTICAPERMVMAMSLTGDTAQPRRIGVLASRLVLTAGVGCSRGAVDRQRDPGHGETPRRVEQRTF
jgi:hypothetical protein